MGTVASKLALQSAWSIWSLSSAPLLDLIMLLQEQSEDACVIVPNVIVSRPVNKKNLYLIYVF